jgi:Tol biopolymer transport system component
MEPRWSPDGHRILYSWRGADPELTWNVKVMDADGGHQRFLTHLWADEDLTGAPAPQPQWSPSGSRIVFVGRTRHDWSDLWTMRSDGTKKQRLTGTSLAHEGHPLWSPDGRRILFTATKHGRFHWFTIGPGGGPIRRLSVNANPSLPVSWSPRGRWIAGVHTVGRASSRRSMLVLFDRTGRQRPVTSGTVRDSAPSWAPSGRRLVFCRSTRRHERWQPPDIYRTDLRGRHIVRLTRNSASDCDPVWSPAPAAARLPWRRG